ncbi:retrovirus-related pol polyprotein LINE-1 [Tanacetum coccineum]
MPHFDCYYSRINKTEVRTALQKMGRNKIIFTSAKMPKEWRLSEVIPIFKNKGDAQVCSNYIGIKILGRTMKLWEIVIERILQRETMVSENQFGFMPSGSEISPYQFALILDELSRRIHKDIPWCLIFADDIASVSKSVEGLNNRLENQREALADNGLRVRREKIEYLICDFEEVDICIGDKILQPKDSFRYLGSMIHKSEMIDEDVSHRIKAAWLKWRAATRVLCDRNVPLKLKGKFYRVAIRPSMSHGAELKVETIINKMREGRLRWFGHVRRRPQSSPVKRVEALVVDGSRRKGRPKLRWEDRVKNDMKVLLLSEDMTFDRNEWMDRIILGG